MLNLSIADDTLIITVGNTLRSDDGVGPYIAERLKNRRVINAGNTPENILDEVMNLKPQKVLIIDAADFGGQAGEIKIIPPEQIPETTLSTHTFPLKVIAKIIEKDTQSEVYFLGIQPLKVSLGEGLSPKVKTAAEEVINFLCTNCTY